MSCDTRLWARRWTQHGTSPVSGKEDGASGDGPLVLIVDDEPAVGSAIRRLLRANGFTVHVFLDTEHLAAFGRPAVPCCLILDVHLPEVDGVEFLERRNRAGVRMPTIFITGFGSVPISVRAMKAGAVDFLPKPFDADELLRAARRALALDEELLRREREADDVNRRYSGLTEREREVFFAVTNGLLNKQVGAELGVTEKTIKVHRARVMDKMEAESLAQLVRMAETIRRGSQCLDELGVTNVDVQSPPVAS